MSATCSERSPGPARGFTVVELVAVIVLLGVVSVVALPKIDGAMALRQPAWRDQVLASLRSAHSLAQGRRRLVCATLATGAVTLRIASTNPAAACDTALPGGDGDAAYASDSYGIALAVSPAGTLYFQPSGRISSDAAGNSALNASVSVGSETAITVVGETGHVE